jgi:dTDP-4-dehydrorhamnose reductase
MYAIDTLRRMKIVITGASGQLGRALQRALVSHDVRPLHRATALRHALAELNAVPPDVIIHAAALTNTQRCEANSYEAYQVNGKAVGRMAELARELGARLVAISTNEVFAGNAREPLAEDAATNTVNTYGASKLLGERLAMETLPERSLIVRTAWLYGESADNFVAKVLAAARAGKPLRFVTDEIATPTYANDLADAIRELIEHPDTPPGIYHLTNEGEASRYEWAREIARLAGLDESRVEPVTTAELRSGGYDGPRKPPYSVLANTRARALGITLRPWREALAAYFARVQVAADG